MADKTVKTRIQVKRGTESNWNTASNSTPPFKPLDGELIYYTDKGILKIGNDTDTPKDLPVLADGCTKDYVSTEIGKLKFAGASTQGGAATSAAKLTNTTAIGSATTPVYFSSEGVPVACNALPYAAADSNGNANAAKKLVDADNADLNEGYDSTATNPKHQPVYFKDGTPVAFDPGHASAADTGGDRPAKGAYRILKSNAVLNNNHGVGTTNQPIFINSAGLPQACTGITIPVDTPVNIAKQLQTGTKFTFNNGAISAPEFVFNGSSNADGTQKTINIAATSVDESYLAWGSKNLANTVSPLDTAISDVHRANRFAFMKPEMIDVSYARGTDTTFTSYGASAEDKVKLVSGISASFNSGKRTKDTVVGDRVRVELSSKYIYDQANDKSYNVYCTLRKLLIYVSVTYSTVYVKVEAKPFNSTTLLDCGTFQISGWSGWNSIPTRCTNTTSNTHKKFLRFGNTNSGYQSTDYIEKLVLTFTVDAVDSSKTSNYVSVHNIIAVADTSWDALSNMAKTGHMYTWDANQNVAFPGSITAAAGFRGTADVATKLGTVDVGGQETKDNSIRPGRDVDDIPIFLKGGVPTPCKRIPTILTGSTAPADDVGKDGDMYLMPYATNIPAIYSGTTMPDHSIGVNGDIYILYE
jgi:hypothetical protein